MPPWTNDEAVLAFLRSIQAPLSDEEGWCGTSHPHRRHMRYSGGICKGVEDAIPAL